MQKKLKVAVCGLGSRGTVYSQILSAMPDQVELVAAADIDPEKLSRYAEQYHIPADKCFASGEEMLAQEKLADIMVIATWDRLHHAQAIAAMNKGYHLLLEKPISSELNDCLEVAETAKRLGREVVVCHVLRYAPFFGMLKKIIASGKIGEVVSIEADEKVQYWHQAHSFVRGNWRNSVESSPMILQKSCHDMDILLWLTGKHCVSVSSFGSLRHFKPEFAPEGATERCNEDCPHYETCPFSVYNCYIKKGEQGHFEWPVDVVTQVPTMEALRQRLKSGPYGRCVYHCDNDVVDHQMVNLLLEDGVTVSFSMCAFTSTGGRRLHVMGTKGDIIGEMDSNKLRVCVFGQEPEWVDTSRAGDVFGHGGGDGGLITELVELFDPDKEKGASLTSIHDSVESHVVALAAEQSRVNGGKLVQIADFVKA